MPGEKLAYSATIGWLNVEPVCGDSRVGEGEDCDDGNTEVLQTAN
jgi:hypothetical protein